MSISEQISLIEVNLGFITLQELEPKCYRAAILITDHKGRPLELRTTEPVRPTSVQVVIYGSSLIPTIAYDLCGKPLLASVKNSPTMIITDNQAFALLSEPELPVIIVPSNGHISKHEAHDNDILTIDEPIIPISFNQLVWPSDMPDENKQQISPVLEIICDNIDLREPFTRINAALKLIHEQDNKKARN